MTNAILRGKPDAGNPHVRFDEGEVASAKPRRGSLLYIWLGRKINIFCPYKTADLFLRVCLRTLRIYLGDKVCVI